MRQILSTILAGAFVALTSTSSTAQVVTTELQFSTPPASGQACLAATSDDNIVWGTAFIDLKTGAICSNTAVADDNIVWGTATDDFDNIVWGTSIADDNIVWGTAIADDNIVWGTAIADDNIVWGTSISDDNIVWGTSVTSDF